MGNNEQNADGSKTYWKCEIKLMELRPGLNPVTIMMDFERAHVNSFKSVFLSASIPCCLFHLSQNVYRKVCEIGFKERYHHDDEFSIKIRWFPSLAFLPPNDVIDGFEELVDDDDPPQELASYFEISYIGCFRGRGDRQGRTPLLFPIDSWNVHLGTESEMPRTNKHFEGYHNALQSSLSCTHPNIWKLITALKRNSTWPK
ncbi:uncharacterized protein [Palaemon carinicauda]|uniref:uncharacterized protein n=1 Tax=Palaemon carinicauda TaxID=392227 RepID=UPI0035B5BFD7